MAYRPSVDSDWVWYGSVTVDTFGAPLSAVTVFSTAVWLAGVVSVDPSGAANTTRAVDPPACACGNRSDSWSIARCASVPGMVNVFDILPDMVAAPMPM